MDPWIIRVDFRDQDQLQHLHLPESDVRPSFLPSFLPSFCLSGSWNADWLQSCPWIRHRDVRPSFRQSVPGGPLDPAPVAVDPGSLTPERVLYIPVDTDPLSQSS